MTKERAGAYISKLVFNNDEELEINKNDIVVFVGPNNVGKSQSLKDIRNLAYNSQYLFSKVVKSITLSQLSGNIIELIDTLRFKSGTDAVFLGQHVYLDGFNINNTEKHSINLYKTLYQLLICEISTARRLNSCGPVDNINNDEEPNDVIQYIINKPECQDWLSLSYKKAFGVPLIVNKYDGRQISLRIGNEVSSDDVKKKVDSDDMLKLTSAYTTILESYDKVNEQGDGIKSFVGILLYLAIEHYCTFLIDEPESFLHPPQARIMGQIIGEKLDDSQQAFISTHSEDIIKGLIDVAPERVKIIRITRNETENSFLVLENERLKEIWSDPLLKYSNIMSCLFHNKVIICESDSDCKMYSFIENALLREKEHYSETLFIHCGGKDRVGKIARALKALDIDVRVILDIDVLNAEQSFKSVVEAMGMDWASIEQAYNILVKAIKNKKKSLDKQTFKENITNLLEKNTDRCVSDEDIKQIRSLLKSNSPWNEVKENGKSAIPSGDASERYEQLDSILKMNSIFLVPVGELECFIKSVGGHGPNWVTNVIEKYPDVNDSVYKSIKEFVSEVIT